MTAPTSTGALDEVKGIARTLFARRPLEVQPLMRAMQQGELPIEQARDLALQMHHVVAHFPQLLAALAANVPDWRRRSSIAENLWEEHGRGKAAHVHVETYRQFLETIGVTSAQLQASQPALPVIAYNRAVRDLCFHYPYPEGLGALGAIEEIVSRASPVVARYAISRLDLEPGEVAHFPDHEVLDVTHADEFYELAAAELTEATRPAIERGMALGVYYHFRLYDDLLGVVRARPPDVGDRS